MSRALVLQQSPRTVLSLLAVGATLGFSLAACDRAAPGAPTPLTVSTAQFQQLRWLEGDWRGSGGGIDGFFERYRWVDDSTIHKFDFADSTLGAPTDSSAIELRGGIVRTGSPAMSWVVVALDSTQATFAPERNASNGFEWRHTGPGAWTARLTWDSAGVARERVYEMRAR